MRTVLKWIARVLGVLLGLIVLAALAAFIISGLQLNKVYDVQVEAFTIPSDDAAIERGQHIAEAWGGCTQCHGDSLAGDEFINSPGFVVLYAKNLTAGEGGIGATYTDEDWIRALRHGVNQDRKSVVFMPSQHFTNMSDADLGALIAYMKSVSPVDNNVPDLSFGPLGRLFILVDPTVLPAKVIDHEASHTASVQAASTVAYGEYLVNATVCTDCHGQDLNGVPPFEPGDPPSANLTPGGELAGWSEEDFIRAVQTGINPAGRELNQELMPKEFFLAFTDEELAAIFAYLKSLPALKVGY